MKAVIARAAGGPEVLEVVDRPRPAAGPGEVIIRTIAISVESGDLMMRGCFHSSKAPAVLGYASAGEVIETGSGTPDTAIGATVLTFGFDGAYAEYRRVPWTHSFPIPSGLDPAIAIAGFIGPTTAALAVDLGGVSTAETVLVSGGAGGVGFAAMQLARSRGARAIATVRSPRSLSDLREQGFDAVLVESDTNLAARVAEINDGRGADLLIDTIGGDALTSAMGTVVDGGRVVIVGITGPGDPVISTASILTRRLTVRGCFLGAIITNADIRSMIDRTLILVRDGRIKVPMQRIFPLDAAAEAHALAEQPESLGKVVMSL